MAQAALMLLTASVARAQLDPPVSRLRAALGGQRFALTVSDGGAATLSATTGSGEHLTTVSSGFSSPGPEWNEFRAGPASAKHWKVTVDRSRAAQDGVWSVKGERASFSVHRTYTLEPPPSVGAARRVLVNDTIATPASLRSASIWAAAPAASDVLGISVRHRATVAASAEAVDTAIVPGAYGGDQCGTSDNPGELCGANCFDRDVLRTNNGRPDVFANRSTGGSAFGVGLVALDDVFRVHAQTLQMAMAVGPRMTGMRCNVSDPPMIELADPTLAMRRTGDAYVQEWAIYPFFSPGTDAGEAAVDPEGGVVKADAEQRKGCTDFYCFVNAQRHDLGSSRIPMQRTGFLGPGDSTLSDLSIYEGSGYDGCYDKSLPNPNAAPKPRATAKTCWESWNAQSFLDFIHKQGGPGGFVHISNEVHTGDRVWPVGRFDPNHRVTGCGQVTLDGNRFADPSLQPATFKTYFANVVNQTRAANALLPAGAPRHKTIMYTDNFASTGVNDSDLFSDSLIKRKDGTQTAYKNCTTKTDNVSHVSLLGFYADGKNSFSQLLKQYYLLVLEMGADGIFHDEFPASKQKYTYHAPWDNRTAWLDPKTLAVQDGPLPSNLVLLTNEHELELARLLDDKGAFMVMNGAPQTRSWFRNALTATAPTINENENGEMWRALHVQLYTPVMLTRYGGNKHDPDPKYNYTKECPGPSTAERKVCFSDLCRCFSDHLDYGTLSMTYGSLWHNDTRENIYGHLMPTTATEIGEGFVIGLERTVTKVSGMYAPPGSNSTAYSVVHTSGTVYTYEKCFLKSTSERVLKKEGLEVQLMADEIAVVVWNANNRIDGGFQSASDATAATKTDDLHQITLTASTSVFSSSSTLSVLADADFPQAGAAMFRRLSASNSGRSNDEVPTPTYITTNPLKDLPALPKVHHLCEGIDPTYLNGPWPHSNWTRVDSWALLVDYARITGAFPSMKDTAGTLDTAVQVGPDPSVSLFSPLQPS
jgi:hypothetical protein